MSWTVHLAARRPRATVLAILLILLGLFAVRALGGPALPPAIYLIAALVLLGSIAEFLFPVTYTLDERGAHARHFGSRRVLAWADVRRVYLRPDGIKLSPLARPDWREAYRGVLLRTPERDAVLAQARAWLATAGVTVDVVEE